MKTRIIAATALSIALLAVTTQAQYTDNNQTNTISGVASNWVDDVSNPNAGYVVGSNWVYDALIIQSGGVLSNGFAYIGYEFGADNNTVLVTDPGSVWSNMNSLSVGAAGSGNSLTIANGGTVRVGLLSGYSVIGGNAGANNNTVLVTGNGSALRSTFGPIIGEAGSGNTLTVANAGVVSGNSGRISFGIGSGLNTVLVTGSGSVWSNAGTLYLGPAGTASSLTISNGGKVFNADGWVGGDPQGFPGSNNTVLVAGTGSVWSNTGEIVIGFFGGGNSLTISNGGAVFSHFSMIGFNGDGNNTVLVTGSGSVWSNASDLYVGDLSVGNSVTISNGGAVVTPGTCYIGNLNDDNAVLVTGSGSVLMTADLYVGVYGAGNSLTVTTGAVVLSTGTLVVSSAGGSDSLILNGGSVTVNQLVLTNGSNSVIAFNGGLLTSGGTSVTNSQLFVVGDGTDAATFQLNGGVHSFADNLEISSDAVLTGCGTIDGNVTIDPGGTVNANCGGTLTFTGIVTNNGTMLVVNGTVLQVDGQMVNNGLINVINGSTQFLGGLVDNGCMLTADDARISSITRSGNDIAVQIPSAACGTYQLQVTPSLNPATWTNLSASQGGTGGVLSFTDTNGATNRPSRFYRIHITAQAQVISFAGNGAGWQVNSSGIATAPFTGDVLTLTDNNGDEARSAWYTIQQFITLGFTASFTYQAGGNKQADGVTFAIQNSGTFALGFAGGSLGYASITPSAAVQINIYPPSGVGTGYGTNGLIAQSYTNTSPVNPASGDPINVTLVYDPIAGTLSESLQDTSTSQTFNTLYNVGDLSTLLGDSKAYIGFTGGTGGLASTQTISNFQFSAAPPP